jgi:hypothetical protein
MLQVLAYIYKNLGIKIRWGINIAKVKFSNSNAILVISIIKVVN